MAAMMNPRIDVVRYTTQDLARAERRMHQLRQIRRHGVETTVPEVTVRRSRIRFPVPVQRTAVNPV